MVPKRLRNLIKNMLRVALVGAFGLVVGCAGNEPNVRVAVPQVESAGEILYQTEFVSGKSVTSATIVRFTRDSDDGGTYVWEIRGPLSYVSASLLFPEDTYILFSEVKQLYMKNNAWYDRGQAGGSKFVRALEEQLSPGTLPEYLPFGVGGGYHFMKKMLENDDVPKGVTKTDYLANRYHSMDVALIEKHGIDGLLVSVPVRKLHAHTRYDTRVMVAFNDGHPRTLDKVVYLELE